MKRLQRQHNTRQSAELAEKINVAVARQDARGCWNAYLTSDQVDRYCVLAPDAQEIIKKAFNQLSLSMRGYHKVLKLSRTIADLENSDMIETAHVREALMYRSLEQSRERCT